MEEHGTMEGMILDRIDSYAKYCNDYNALEFQYDKENKDIPILIFDLKKILADKNKNEALLYIKDKLFSAIHAKYEYIKSVLIYSSDFETCSTITKEIFKALKKLTFYPLIFSSLKIVVVAKCFTEDIELAEMLAKTNSLLVINDNNIGIECNCFDNNNRYLINYKVRPEDSKNLSEKLLENFSIHRKPIYLSIDLNVEWTAAQLKELKNELHLITEVMVNDIDTNAYYPNSSWQPIIFNIFRAPFTDLENTKFTYFRFPKDLKENSYMACRNFQYILRKENYYFHHKAKKLNPKLYGDNTHYYDVARGYRYMAKIGKYLDKVLLYPEIREN